MRSKAWVALLLLLPAMMLERVAYYGARSILLIHIRDVAQLSTADAVDLYSIATSLGYLAAVGAGALAIGIGPRPTAILGALASALGLALTVGPSTARAGVLITMVGAGIFRPCTIAAAAEVVAGEDVGPSGEPLPPGTRRFAVLAAICTIAYGAVNLGAAFAPVSNSALFSAFGGGAVLGSCAALEVLVAVFVGISALVSHTTRARAATAAPPNAVYRMPAANVAAQAAAPPNAVAGLALLAVPMLVYGVAMSLGWTLEAYAHASSAATRGLVQAINPVVVIVTSLGLSIVWIVSAGGRAALPPLRVWGVGFAIFGIGLLPLGLGIESGGALFILGTIIMAIGEAAIGPIASTYAALALKPRFATLGLALMSLVGWVGSSASSSHAVRVLGMPTAILMFFGVVCLVVGVLAARSAAAIHGKFFGASNG